MTENLPVPRLVTKSIKGCKGNISVLCNFFFCRQIKSKPSDGESLPWPDAMLVGNNVQMGSYSVLRTQPSVLLCNNRIMLRVLGKNSDDTVL